MMDGPGEGREMERPTCKTCPYFQNISADWVEPEDRVGQCQRFPPSRKRKPYDEDRKGLPPMFSPCDWPEMKGVQGPDSDTFWCGEHPDFPEYLRQQKLAALKAGAEK